MKLHTMWDDYPEISEELLTTLQLMEDAIKLKNKPVEKHLKEMIHSGGKLLRPAYQLLFSQFGPEQDREKAIALAASIEMLHTATLIHDDIVDVSELRRGQQTIQAKFGNDVAVYSGDYLFVCCFKLMADYSNSMRSLQFNSRSMEKVLNGELGQMDSRYNYNLSVDQYLENISGKTAELFSLSCFIGAYESGSTERFAKKAKDIGQNIGIAFQIIDDILDYTQTSTQIGKPVLEDVRQGIYSLPLLAALKNNKETLLPLLEKKEQMDDKDTQEVYALVQALGGISYAQELATTYTQRALKDLEKLPDNAKQTKQILLAITKKILTRKN
ncbi:MAG: polyprenyl synthetase family protein [Enterococcus sp.]